MGFLNSLRNAIAGPPRIRGGGDEAAEVDAALHEEYTVPAPREEGKEIEEAELHSDEQAAPAGAAPWAGAAFATPSADLGPEREAEQDEQLETLEAEIEPEEDRADPDS